MKLTKEKALELHRELWDWLSKNPEKRKSQWPGWVNYDSEWARGNQFCFACAGSPNACEECLLEWPGVDCCNDVEEGDDKGLFMLWDNTSDPVKHTRLAEQIRDLPLRED